MAKTKKKAQGHAILFPFMAQGHLAPFRSLAALLRRHRPDMDVTVVGTPGVITSLRASLASDGLTTLQFHALPFFPADHGLPADADTSANVSFQHLITLFRASESLRAAFEEFVSSIIRAEPAMDIYIVADMFFGWTVDVKRESSNIFHSIVITGGGYGMALYFSLWMNVPLPLTTSPDDDFALPQFPWIRIRRSQLTDHLAAANGTDTWSVFIRKQISSYFRADALLINTTEDLDRAGLEMLRAWLKVPICPVGPLLRPSGVSVRDMDRPILEWLDKQPPASVLYISFGSQYTIQLSQMMELAMGLEASKQKFIWIIRPPDGFDVKGEFKPEWLPSGFRERMAKEGRGLVVRCWAPQVEILAHESTGAFLSHCGWNSVLESLSHGVPMIGWPLSAEQFYNAKMLAEELGVCVELARGNGESSEVGRDRVAQVAEMMLGVTKERDAMRRKASEVKKMIEAARDDDTEGSSARGLQKFFRALATKTNA